MLRERIIKTVSIIGDLVPVKWTCLISKKSCPISIMLIGLCFLGSLYILLFLDYMQLDIF